MNEEIFNIQQKIIFCVNMIDTLNRTIAEISKSLADLQKNAKQNELISVKQAAHLLGVSENMIRNKINNGQLERIYIGSCVRVRASDVLAINDKYEPRSYAGL